MSERAIARGEKHVAGTVLVIPFSELGTKSDVSRAKMLDQLLTNIKHVLKDVFHVPWVKFRTPGERLVFSFKREDVDAAMFALQHVPGILRLHACVETQPRPEAISKKVRELEQQGLVQFDASILEVRALFFDDKREKDALIESVTAKLREQAPQRSVQVVGREETASLQLCTYIEMHPAFAYICLERREGLNGHPVGTQNPVVAEIIGRGGDLLATLLAIKRGIVVTPVFFSINTMAIDLKRYNEMVANIKRSIDLFHGFPVKRYFFVPLDKVLSLIAVKTSVLMYEHPCTCCIIARRAILNSIISRNVMTNFVVQGSAREAPSLKLASCPLDVSVNPATNPDGLFLVNPLLTGTQELPPIFSSQLERLPEPPEKDTGYTWSFCKFRSRDKAVNAALEDVRVVHGLVSRLATEQAKDLVVFFDGDLPSPR